jgi:hypothetical protein
VSKPSERVREYLRQRKMHNNSGDIIHGTWTDPVAEMADLTISDLEEVLELAEQYERLCD